MRTETKPEQAQWRGLERATTAIGAAAGLLVFTILAFACATAAAQTAGLTSPSPLPPDTPPPSKPPGVFDALGNWVQQGVANMGAGFGAMVGTVGGQASQAAKEAADAARNAATTVKLPVAGVTGGRERCMIAPNGAPDCRAAAEALCRAKGYVGGSSVDFETVEKCPPPYRVSRRDAPQRVCTMEHFVTKALCQ